MDVKYAERRHNISLDENPLDEQWMKTENCDIKNTVSARLGALILCNSKRIMNNFIRAMNGFYNNNVFYTDTDSLYI